MLLIKKIINYLSNNTYDYDVDPEWVIKLNILEDQINYKFKNKSLLTAALTHDSFNKKIETEDSCSSYERMEFLGDSILGLVVAEYLFANFPNKDEGDLSKEKSNIVCEKFLAIKAANINLGEFMQMSEEERRNGGEGRKSIIADTMEALIFIFLDSGLKQQVLSYYIIEGYEKEIFLVIKLCFTSLHC